MEDAVVHGETSELFQVHTPAAALDTLLQRLPKRVLTEEIATADGLDRILAEDLRSESDLPGFPRSTMDGYAVRASDTFGATEGLPAYFRVAGDVLMGQAPTLTVEAGECARIATGGMVPQGSDAVVMVEQTHIAGDSAIEVLRAVAPGENVVQVGEDIRAGELVLSRGHTLRPQDVGGLLALGITRVTVARRLTVGIISGGDEVVAPDREPEPGQIRDINSYTLASLVKRLGHEPWMAGVYPDDYDSLLGATRLALAKCDLLLLSAGSSVSTRDMTARVIRAIGEPGVLVHGVSLRPGKPTILALCGEIPVFGLPGNPVSCMVTFDLFVRPTLARMCGATATPTRQVRAQLVRNIASTAGREDYVQVRLERDGERTIAVPVFGKSNLIYTLVRADGMVKVELDKGGLAAGEEVDVTLF